MNNRLIDISLVQCNIRKYKMQADLEVLDKEAKFSKFLSDKQLSLNKTYKVTSKKVNAGKMFLKNTELSLDQWWWHSIIRISGWNPFEPVSNSPSLSKIFPTRYPKFSFCWLRPTPRWQTEKALPSLALTSPMVALTDRDLEVKCFSNIPMRMTNRPKKQCK